MVLAQKLGREYKQIPVELIKSSQKPPREVFEDIQVLAATIKRHGLLQPVLVKQLGARGFEVVVGERRLRACRKAGLAQVPCIVVDGVNEEQILSMQLVENIQRNDLKVFEEIRIVEMLKDRYDLSCSEISAKTGISASAVHNYLTISKGLPQEYIKMISHGSHKPKDLTITKALILARANLPADQLKETVELIRRKGLSRAQLSRRLARQERKKIKRVVAGRTFWNELTRTLKEFARFWSDYTELTEWQDVRAYHLTLKVVLPKDINETYEPSGLQTLAADEAPQICGSCGENIVEGDEFAEKEGLYYCSGCAAKGHDESGTEVEFE